MHPRPLQFAQSGSLVCGMSGLLRGGESGAGDDAHQVGVDSVGDAGTISQRLRGGFDLRVGRLLCCDVIPRRLPARDVCTSLALGEAVVVDRFLLEGVPVALILARSALECGLGECVEIGRASCRERV